MTTELFGFCATGVLNEEFSVVFQEQILNLALGCLIDVLLVESYDSSDNCLTDCVDLGDVSSTLDLYSNINFAKFLLSDEQYRFHDLGP